MTMTAAPAAPAAWPPPPPGPQLPGGVMTWEEFRTAVREIFRDTAGRLGQAGSREQAAALAAEHVTAWAERQARAGRELPAARMRDGLARAVLDEQFGLGPLQPYADDPEVENIDINGPGPVRVTLRDGRRMAGRPVATSDSELMELVRTWGLREGQTPREFSAARPVLHAALGGAGVRLAAVMSVTPQVHVSIRCHRLVDITLDELCDPGYGTVSPELAHFLACAVRARKNIIVTGGVDAGKTTLLRALSAALDPEERIATLETEYELYLHLLPARHRDVVPFEARQANSEGAGAVTLHDLIPAALRLNPRRIILGEVRDTEIRPMLEAMNSGQEGSMCTLHANSADEVFGRILMLAQRGQLALPPAVIHLEVGMARPFVVHIRKDPATHQRYVSEVIEVLPPGDGDRPDRNRVFSPSPADGRAVPDHSLSPAALDGLLEAGLNPAVLGARP